MNATTKQSPANEASSAHPGAVEQQMHRLVSEFSQPDDSLSAAFSFHLSSGGKRTRAAVCLSSSQALELCGRDGIALAAAVELLHNASLIQDDFQDRSPRRRGLPAIWEQFGENTAVGLTDLAISASFRALADLSLRVRLPHLLTTLHRAIAITLRGQADDLGGAPETVSSALSTAQRKSGPLFALALELPLMAAGQESHVNLAREAAEAFGLGYQICDDVLDVEEDRSQGSRGNVVLVLERTMSREAALARAQGLAEEYLECAASAARLLPKGCGDALVTLTTAVTQRLTRRFHG